MNPRVRHELQRLVAASGMAEFRPSTPSYQPVAIPEGDVRIVPITSVKMFDRNPKIDPFDDQRSFDILDGFRNGHLIPPVEVFDRSPETEPPFEFELYNGFHRFHLSLAVGFTHIPVQVIARFSHLLDA